MDNPQEIEDFLNKNFHISFCFKELEQICPTPFVIYKLTLKCYYIHTYNTYSQHEFKNT